MSENNNLIINECFNDSEIETEDCNYVTCPCCDEDYLKDNMDFSDVIVDSDGCTEQWCDDCVSRNAVYSEYHGQYISDDCDVCYPRNYESMVVLESHVDNGDFYYSEHYGEYLYKPWDDSDYERVYDYDDNVIDYVEEYDCRGYYAWAYDVERWYENYDCVSYCEEDDEYYRYEDNMPERTFDDECIYSYHTHKNYFKFVGDPEDENHQELHLGFELEIENRKGDYRNSSVCKYIKENDNGLFVFENDGSLDSGFECITNITTFKFLEDNYESFKELCKGITRMGMRSHDTSTCGLHIHINRKAFGATYIEQNETIQKVIMLVEGHMKEVTRFARRAHESYARFRCSEEEWNSADLEGKKELVKSKWSNTAHSLNVNLEHSETVEFRMFRGTLKWETLFMSIIFCYNLIKCARNYTEDELPELDFNAILNANPKYATRMQEYYELCRPRW